MQDYAKSGALWRIGSPVKKKQVPQSLYLIILFVVLWSIGIANLYSAAYDAPYVNAQLIRLAIGTVTFAVVGWLIPIRFVNTYGNIFYLIICMSLLVVLALGHTAGGSQRWLILGPIRIQPSEFAKIAVAITVARFFYIRKLPHPYRLRDLWPVLVASGVIFAFIFMQPDFGTAGICLLIAAAQVAFVRIDIKSILIVASASIISGIIGWSFLLRPYQKLRILNFLNPNLDPTGSGYNSLQSLVAIGSGNLWGKGFMEGTQTQLQFLPARHTDFIFSVFAEEHGFWGCIFIFILFAWLAFVALEIGRRARDSFNALLAVGITALIFIEFTINIAMVLGIFPVVGMPLPFFSYGGSSLLTICIAMALLVSIDRDNSGADRTPKIGKTSKNVQIS